MCLPECMPSQCNSTMEVTTNWLPYIEFRKFLDLNMIEAEMTYYLNKKLSVLI